MNLVMVVTIGVLVLFVPILGGLMAATPWLMRRNECFAVTVPADKQRDPRLMALKRSYTKKMIAFTAVCTVAVVVLFAWMAEEGLAALNNPALPVVLVVGMMLPIGAAYSLMLRCRSEVRRIKAEEGWTGTAQQATALLAEEDVPSAVPLAWNLLYIPLLLATMALCAALYPLMPQEIPVQMTFAGEVVRTMPKWPGVFLFPAAFTVFMAAVMTMSHWAILRSKKHSDPSAPATSAFAYGMFARAQSIFLLAMGLVLTALIGAGFVLSSAQLISMESALVVIMLAILFVVVGAIAISAVYGQAGSKLYARMQAGEADVALVADDDAHWILGIIYYNPDDASLFLPERFGIGWTVNMARPAAWGIIAGLVAITVAFVAVVSVTTGL